jgi:uncharacterized protein (TIGR02231 family)
MRNTIHSATALLALALGLGAAAQVPAPEKKDPAQPTRLCAVTVYEDRALVSRQADAALPAGPSTLKLTGFPAGLDEASLRATVDGAGVKVISVTSRTEQRAEAASEAVRKAEAELDALDRQRLRLTSQRDAATREEALLGSFEALARQAIAERATLGEADVESFRKAAALFPERRAKLAAERRGLDKDLEALAPKLADAKANFDKISSAGAKTLRTVEVSLDAVQPAKARVTIAYIVHNCGWSPKYEARLAGGRLTLAYQGEVRQKTGEDWTAVRMALSTARPALGAARPDLPALRMETVKVETPRPMVKSVAADAARAPAEVETNGPAGGRAAESSVAARSEDAGVSVLFQVPGVVDVPSDGRAHKAPVTSFTDEKPELCFETVPKLMRYVYLRCDTANQTSFPMLAGPVDVWRESGFVGTSAVKFTPPKGRVALSFGVDENLKVRRVREYDATATAGLTGGKRVRSLRYDIEVANYYDTPRTVRVRENYPVSDVAEVTVALGGAATPPTENDAKQGFLLWALVLQPGQAQTVRLAYDITMPKDFTWNEDAVPAEPWPDLKVMTH